MLHNIIVVGSRETVDALISKLRGTTSMHECCEPVDLLSQLGFREYHFKNGDDEFTLRHISTTKIEGEFTYSRQINEQLAHANLCIACDQTLSTIDFLNLASRHSICFIANDNDVDMYSEIKRVSSAKQMGKIVLGNNVISRDFIHPSNTLERRADALADRTAAAAAAAAFASSTAAIATQTVSAATSSAALFNAAAKSAMQGEPRAPDVGNSIPNSAL